MFSTWIKLIMARYRRIWTLVRKPRVIWNRETPNRPPVKRTENESYEANISASTSATYIKKQCYNLRIKKEKTSSMSKMQSTRRWILWELIKEHIYQIKKLDYN